MNKVKMLKDCLGSVDGVHVKMFVEGSEYLVPESLLKDFISLGAVELSEEVVVDSDDIEETEEKNEAISSDEGKGRRGKR